MSEEKNPVKKKKKKQRFATVKEFFNSVAGFFKDERLHKVIGLTCLLLCAYLLIAFTSYIFTWKTDQSVISRMNWHEFLDADIKVENWLGKLGALISHWFMNEWLGVSSYALVLLLFLSGVRIILKISLLPVKKTFFFLFFATIWLSTVLNYLVTDSDWLFLGGRLGYLLNTWLNSVIGKIGTGFILAFSALVYLVVKYNIPFIRILSFFRNIGKIFQPTVPKPLQVPIEGVNETKPEPFTGLFPELKIEQPALPEKDITTVPGITAIEMNPVSKSGDEQQDGELEFSIETAASNEKTLSEDEIESKVKDFGPYDPTLELRDFRLPGLDLLKDHGSGRINVDREELESNKNRIVDTLRHFNIEIKQIKATVGPAVTLYEIVPKEGTRISRIKNLEDDIALSLSALGIRIIAPIPGKGTIGIEVPNQRPETVSMKTLIASEKFQNTDMDLPLALGKTIADETYVVDLTKMPHLLMSGATGQGKSVGLNAILVSLLYKKHPSHVKFVLVDPKRVELTLFNQIEKHYLARLPDSEEAIITDTKKVVNTLNSLCVEMESRLNLFNIAGVRNIREYNSKFIARGLNPNNGHKFLPYIVLVIDEFADLIMTAGKEIEMPIARLAQLARATGLHLIIATQRPSVNIITGTIKANFPTRIAFKVSSKIDSRTILDTGGADQLIGRGDMLLSTGSDVIRLQCPFVDISEVEEITKFIGAQRGYVSAFELPEYVDESAQIDSDIDSGERDEMFDEAARIVVQHQQGSASLLQRRLKLGYNRAGRLIDQLEFAGIVGQNEGSKARQVLIHDEYSLEQHLRKLSENNGSNNDKR